MYEKALEFTIKWGKDISFPENEKLKAEND